MEKFKNVFSSLICLISEKKKNPINLNFHNEAQYVWARKEKAKNLRNQVKLSFSTVYNAKEFFLQKKSFLRKSGENEQKTKRFFNFSR